MKIISNSAISIDGKISSQHGSISFLGSKNDRKRMLEIRDQCDAVLMGGNTFRAHPFLAVPLKPKKQYWHIILSSSLILPFTSDFLANPAARKIVLTDNPNRENLPVESFFSPKPINPEWIVSVLRKQGIKKLLIEGGGEIIYQFLEYDLLDEMYVTVCPIVIGGNKSPSLVGGLGFPPGKFKQLKVLDLTQIRQELFIHYKVK